MDTEQAKELLKTIKSLHATSNETKDVLHGIEHALGRIATALEDANTKK